VVGEIRVTHVRQGRHRQCQYGGGWMSSSEWSVCEHCFLPLKRTGMIASIRKNSESYIGFLGRQAEEKS
jgi:hypothetical protein